MRPPVVDLARAITVAPEVLLDELGSTRDGLGVAHWLPVAATPLVLLGAEELRKAVARRGALRSARGGRAA